MAHARGVDPPAAYALGKRRSLLPDVVGLAVREAVRHRTIVPLLKTLVDRYNPSVSASPEHVAELREKTGWDASFRRARVARIRPLADEFELDEHGRFRHVLVAPGHPGSLAARVSGRCEGRPRLRATQLRRPGRRRRCRDGRSDRGSDEPLEAAARAGRFRVAAALNGADQVICATGFLRGFGHDPLLARLAEENELETVDGWIVPTPDCTIPALTNDDRTLALAPAQWAYPAADPLAGAKYAARRFLRRINECRTR